MSVTILEAAGRRFAPHPRDSSVCVRVESPEHAIVMWNGGMKMFSTLDLSTSWQVVRTNHGAVVPLRIKRMPWPGFSHGMNALAVEFS
jgi:hypothetical protein